MYTAQTNFLNVLHTSIYPANDKLWVTISHRTNITSTNIPILLHAMVPYWHTTYHSNQVRAAGISKSMRNKYLEGLGCWPSRWNNHILKWQKWTDSEECCPLGMLRYMALLRTDISEEHIASIMRVTRIGKLGTLAETSNRGTQRRNAELIEFIATALSHKHSQQYITS
jgi:hypothetical protein